jgi:hypothetical protein
MRWGSLSKPMGQAAIWKHEPMILTYVAEIETDSFVLTPHDRAGEWDNLVMITPTDADRALVDPSDVATAFERAAVVLRTRISESGYVGPATLYVWHDAQAAQLRHCISSLGPAQLPFGATYETTTDLVPIVAAALAGSKAIELVAIDRDRRYDDEVGDVEGLVVGVISVGTF